MQTYAALGQLTPSCPGRWVPAAGGGQDCRCPDGSEAQAYESQGQLRFHCHSNAQRRQPDNHVQCGGGRHCPAGNQCSRSGGCQPIGTVDCGSYYCQAGNKCGQGWQACIAQGQDDCGAKVKASCNAGTSCFTAPTDQLKGFTEGKTYCLKPEQLAKVKAQLEETVQDLRDKLKAKRVERKQKSEDKQQTEVRTNKEVAEWSAEAKAGKRKTQQEADDAKRQQRSEQQTHEARKQEARQLRQEAQSTSGSTAKSKTATSQSDSNYHQRLSAAKLDVIDLQEKFDEARSKRARDTERARQSYLTSNEDLLKLADKWNKARSSGDVATATKIHAELQTTKKKSDERHQEYNKLKANTVDPSDASRLQEKIDVARGQVTALEKERRLAQQIAVIPPHQKVNSDQALPPANTTTGTSPVVAATPPQIKQKPTALQGSVAVTNPSSKSTYPASVSRSAVSSQPLTSSGSHAARIKTPVQVAMEKEILTQYRNDKVAIEKVALNADYASLAAAAYSPKNDLKLSGWKRLYILPYENDKTGSNVASVFKSEKTGEIVVAFQGTNEGSDWRTNLRSAVPSFDGSVKSYLPTFETGQVDWAKSTAGSISKKYGGNVTFVGHSLGGRLAQVARIETGAKAVVFDSAPLSPTETAMDKTNRLLKKDAGALTSFRAPLDTVSGVTGGQRGGQPDIVVGNYISSPIIAGPNDQQNHSSDQLAEAMQTVKNVYAGMD